MASRRGALGTELPKMTRATPALLQDRATKALAAPAAGAGTGAEPPHACPVSPIIAGRTGADLSKHLGVFSPGRVRKPPQDPEVSSTYLAPRLPDLLTQALPQNVQGKQRARLPGRATCKAAARGPKETPQPRPSCALPKRPASKPESPHTAPLQ